MLWSRPAFPLATLRRGAEPPHKLLWSRPTFPSAMEVPEAGEIVATSDVHVTLLQDTLYVGSVPAGELQAAAYPLLKAIIAVPRDTAGLFSFTQEEDGLTLVMDDRCRAAFDELGEASPVTYAPHKWRAFESTWARSRGGARRRRLPVDVACRVGRLPPQHHSSAATTCWWRRPTSPRRRRRSASVCSTTSTGCARRCSRCGARTRRRGARRCARAAPTSPRSAAAVAAEAAAKASGAPDGRAAAPPARAQPASRRVGRRRRQRARSDARAHDVVDVQAFGRGGRERRRALRESAGGAAARRPPAARTAAAVDHAIITRLLFSRRSARSFWSYTHTDAEISLIVEEEVPPSRPTPSSARRPSGER